MAHQFPEFLFIIDHKNRAGRHHIEKGFVEFSGQAHCLAEPGFNNVLQLDFFIAAFFSKLLLGAKPYARFPNPST